MTTCNEAILDIIWSGGTIDILPDEDKATGFMLKAWTPQIAGFKNGGVVQDSPIADGRRLVLRYYLDPVETFRMLLKAHDSDEMADYLQEMRQMIEEIANYWVSVWSTSLPYLRARAKGETNTRYAALKNGSMPSDANYYADGFLQPTGQRLLRNLTLALERGQWLENIPGTGTQVQLSNQEAFGLVTFGQEATTGQQVFIANKRTTANLTHVYIDDGGVFGANQVASSSYDLLPAAAVVGDALYFGCQQTVTDAGPFSNLVSDLSKLGTATGVWEYSQGGGSWATITSRTGSILAALGVNLMYWDHPSDWATDTVNGVANTLWIRFRVTGGGTSSTQQNRPIYSVTWPYVRIDSGQVAGDLPALLHAQITGYTNTLATSANKVYMGLRTESRGDDFTPYLNAADEQNPSGITVAVANSTSFVTDIETGVGRIARYNPAASSDFLTRVQFTMGVAISDDYSGVYKALARVRQTGGTAKDFQVKLVASSGNAANIIAETEAQTVPGAGGWEVVDMGLFDLTDGGKFSAGRQLFTITLQIKHDPASGNGDLDIQDIILMPVDEFFCIAEPPSDPLESNVLHLDSIRNPRRAFVAEQEDAATGRHAYSWTPIAGGPAILQTAVSQKLFFLFETDDTASNGPVYSQVFDLLAYRNQRYKSLRGSA